MKKIISKIKQATDEKIISKIKQATDEKKMKIKYHYNCRYDPEIVYNSNVFPSVLLYTRTQNIERYPVPLKLMKWSKNYPEYSPTKFTAKKIYDRKTGDYKDPSENDEDFEKIKWNFDTKKSHCGSYLLEFNKELNVLVPLNPIGRTGIIGRGHLGKWGPNHAADPVVTKWKRDENGNKVIDKNTKKPILQFIAIQRRDTKEWALPGGMIERGEFIKETLMRELAEEALSEEFQFITKVINYKLYTIITGNEKFHKDFNDFFMNGIEIYRGYVDDPRNTDNAWMETVVYNFHDEDDKFVDVLNLKGGSDAFEAKLIDINKKLKLYASHREFLKKVVKYRKAHW